MPEIKTKGVVPPLRFPEFRNAGPWEVKRLGDIGPVSMCKRIMKSQTSQSGDIPFYKIGTFGKEADAYISKTLFDEYKTKYPFPKKGDILISAAGTIGKTVVYDGEPAYFQDSNIVWLANDEKLVTNGFLKFVYQTITWQTDNNTIPRLYNDNLKSIKIFLPTIPEQQKIADCLSSLDELIQAEEKALEALKQHKKGLMQQLFPTPDETIPKLRFPEFRNAGPWEMKRLGEILVFQTGFPFSSKFFNEKGNGLRLIRNADLKSDDRIIYYSGPYDKEFIVQKGDILVGMDGDFSPSIWQKENALLNQRVGKVFAKDGNSQKFLFYILSVILKIIEQSTAQTTVKHLSHSTLEKTKWFIPKLQEQQKIADCLSSLDELIQAKTKRIDALKLHKKGLMQQLFPSLDKVWG